jgi:hypothetical protein
MVYGGAPRPEGNNARLGLAEAKRIGTGLRESETRSRHY